MIPDWIKRRRKSSSSLSALGLILSPANGGTEGGVKTIEKGLGESGGASLKGKGGRVGFRRFLIDFIKVAKNIVIIQQLP